MTTPTVLIIGPGRVGLNLGFALHERSDEQVVLWTPDEEEAHRAARLSGLVVMGGGTPPAPRDDGTVIIAVPDDTIGSVVASLVPWGIGGGRTWLHVSGSRDEEVLRAPGGAESVGTFHPVRPFSAFRRDAGLLEGVLVALGGDARARAVGCHIATQLGCRPFFVPYGARPLYHAACVVASNLPVILAGIAHDLLTAARVDGDVHGELVAGLMGAAADNLTQQAPLDALTGPMARGDVATIQRHVEAASKTPGAGARAYLEISRAAAEWLRDAMDDPALNGALDDMIAALGPRPRG